jgi:hypothetical protein
MLNNFNIEQILVFPFKETESRKNFLIGSLVYLASFIIPIVPLILVMGYAARIMRQVFNGETLSLPAWDDWESMLKDGLLLFGVRLVYMIPVFILMAPLFIASMSMPFLLESNHAASEQIVFIPFLIFGITMLLIFPLSLALGIILPAAESHVIQHGDFAAGFRFREWWAIFRSNLGGFIIAYLIAMVTAFVLTFIVQIAMITIVLICLLPLVMPAISLYITLVMYAAYAQAYKDGKDRLSQ